MQLSTSYTQDRAFSWPTTAAVRARRDVWVDNLVVLLLLVASGHVLFTEGKQAEPGLVAVAVLFTALLEWRRCFVPHPAFVAALMVFAIIQTWQAVSFEYLPLVTFIGFFARLYVAYAAVCLVRDFPRVYVNVLVVVCLASLCFYIPDQLCQAVGLDFRSPFDILHRLIGAKLEHRYDIGLYNFQVKYSHRNAGFFWEPGAFAGFTLMAIVFLWLARSRVSRREYWIAMVIFCAAILTTFSTMGYIVLPIALSLHMTDAFGVSRRKMQVAVLGLCLLPAAWFFVTATWKLDFLSTKINAELSHVEAQQFTVEGGRLASYFFHEPYILARPVAGWGRHMKTYLLLDPHLERNPPAGNGVLRFVHEMGLAGLLTYMVLTAASIHPLTRRHLTETLLILIVIVLTLQGEEFLTGAFYLMFMFLRPER
jgi:hypothetical protein